MDQWLFMGQAAQELHVSKGRISQLVTAGRLDSALIGGRKMVSAESVEAYRKHSDRSKTDKSSMRRFVLMNATHEVMHVTYDSTSSMPFSPIEVLDPSRCPWGTVTRNGKAKRRELNDWWRTRSVPSMRPGVETRLAQLQLSETFDLPFKSLGLSPSDCYWVRTPEDVTTKWAYVNFFENPFDTSHDEERDFWLEHIGLESPDNTTEGALPKRWTIRDGKRVLLKGCRTDDQRPLNEVAATALHRRLLMDGEYVSYEVAATKDGPACSCEEFLEVGEEYIPASVVMATIGTTRGKSFYDRFCRYVGTLGIDEGAYRTHL